MNETKRAMPRIRHFVRLKAMLVGHYTPNPAAIAARVRWFESGKALQPGGEYPRKRQSRFEVFPSCRGPVRVLGALRSLPLEPLSDERLVVVLGLKSGAPVVGVVGGLDTDRLGQRFAGQ